MLRPIELIGTLGLAVFNIDSMTKPMACSRDDRWFVPYRLSTLWVVHRVSHV